MFTVGGESSRHLPRPVCGPGDSLHLYTDAPWKSSITSAPCFSQASDQPPLSSVEAAAISSLAPLFLTTPPTPFPLSAMASTPAHVELPSALLQLIYQEEGEASAKWGEASPGKDGERGGGVVRGAVDGRRMVDFLFTLRRLRRQRSGGGRNRRGDSGQYMYKYSVKIHRAHITKLCWCYPRGVELDGLSV